MKKGERMSEETKQKIRLGNLGKVFSEESKNKMSFSIEEFKKIINNKINKFQEIKN